MSDFSFVMAVSIFAVICMVLITRVLRDPVSSPPAPPVGNEAGESTIEAEHIAAIHAVLLHHLGAEPKTARVTSIKPL